MSPAICSFQTIDGMHGCAGGVPMVRRAGSIFRPRSVRWRSRLLEERRRGRRAVRLITIEAAATVTSRRVADDLALFMVEDRR
uniref:hypothetical protein n=1 Tax=Rhizobium sp. F40D2 TaxID=3453141 RepID=UPI003F24DE39